MSIYMQFAPYKLKSGNWMQQRDALRDTVINTLAEYAPDLPSKILAVQTLTPVDLETHTASRVAIHFMANWRSTRFSRCARFLAGRATPPGEGPLPVRQRNASGEWRNRRIRPQRRPRNPETPTLSFLELGISKHHDSR